LSKWRRNPTFKVGSVWDGYPYSDETNQRKGTEMLDIIIAIVTLAAAAMWITLSYTYASRRVSDFVGTFPTVNLDAFLASQERREAFETMDRVEANLASSYTVEVLDDHYSGSDAFLDSLLPSCPATTEFDSTVSYR
jgi:hypothetical protein